MTDTYTALRWKLEDDRKLLRAKANEIAKKAADERRDLTLEEDVAIATAVADLDSLQTSIRNLVDDDPLPTVKMRSEPATYREGGPNSWFMDMIAARAVTPMPGNDPHGARERLLRNNAETEKHARTRSEMLANITQKRGVTYIASDGQRIHARDLSNTLGYGGEFLPPTWLMEKWVTIARSAAPLLGLAEKLPLPPGCFGVVIPRFRTFATANDNDTRIENVPEQQDPTATTDLLSSVVETVTQYTTISLQAFDRASGPGVMDSILVTEAAEAYVVQAETRLFTGTGPNDGEILGLYNSGFLTTYTDSSPSPQALVVAIGKALEASAGPSRRVTSMWAKSTGHLPRR